MGVELTRIITTLPTLEVSMKNSRTVVMALILVGLLSVPCERK